MLMTCMHAIKHTYRCHAKRAFFYLLIHTNRVYEGAKLGIFTYFRKKNLDI